MGRKQCVVVSTFWPADVGVGRTFLITVSRSLGFIFLSQNLYSAACTTWVKTYYDYDGEGLGRWPARTLQYGGHESQFTPKSPVV